MPSPLRGLVVGAPRSGAGKTTMALGLMRAFLRRGLSVQPFKCGPDYIDPAFHEIAAGRASYNLDTWAMSRAMIAHLAAAAADVAIVEGVMGLFDGAAGGGRSGRGATADLAALLGWPIVLLLDVAGQTETAAAVALGCARFRDDIDIAGVILNRVSSARHLGLIAPALERLGIRLFGALPSDDRLRLPERHLGLVQAREIPQIDARLDGIANAVSEFVDLDQILSIARPAKLSREARSCCGLEPPGQRIALAADQAFSFIYPHLLRHWREAGAQIMPFSPLADEAPDPCADAVWLPGGYPELHAGKLAQARRFLGGLRAAAGRGTAIHGECGGYMVLGSVLVDGDGAHHAMADLLAVKTSFATRRLHLGYRRGRLTADCSLGAKDSVVLGHAFHYASALAVGDAPLLACCDATGAALAEASARRGSVTGSFFHVIAAEVT